MKDFVCEICPRRCGAVRGEGGSGVCGMGCDPVVARVAPHFDEEPVISGTRGSGAVFFSGCALRCRFCQNYAISTDGFGRKISVDQLREALFSLADMGVHNLNMVNPTHFTPAILEALEGGPKLPVVWNTGGYERVETLKTLEGRVQIYLPDLKYMDADSAGRYSAAGDYFDFASKAILEMLRQTGPAVIDGDGLMVRGTMIRHLILPGRAAESVRILDWIAENCPGAWVSLMAQYVPMGNLEGLDELNRPVSQAEYDMVADHLMELGLEDGFVQELSASDEKYIPKFDLTGVPEAWK